MNYQGNCEENSIFRLDCQRTQSKRRRKRRPRLNTQSQDRIYPWRWKGRSMNVHQVGSAQSKLMKLHRDTEVINDCVPSAAFSRLQPEYAFSMHSGGYEKPSKLRFIYLIY